MPTGPNLFNRLHTSLGELIAATEPGERLPTEPKLATMLGVSRATLREAMRTFETQGLIQRRQGVGTFVVRPAGVMETGLELLESIESMAERAGLSVTLGDYKVERRAATEEERPFLGDKVVNVTRVIEAQARPVAFLVDVLPANVLSEPDLQREFSGSVLDLLLRRGSPQIANANTEIHATAVESEVARALRIQRGDVVLHFKSTVVALDGTVVDLGRSYFLPGYFRFRVMRRVDTRRFEPLYQKS